MSKYFLVCTSQKYDYQIIKTLLFMMNFFIEMYTCQIFYCTFPGLFSDTHVLSLIYMGELCYWHIKHQSDPVVEDPDLSPQVLGSSVLHLFLEMVEGPLKDHGWSSQRATQLLEFIEKKES